MRSINTKLGLVATLALVTGCTSGQTNNVPGTTPVNQNTNKLQFAVGTANINGTAGLNTVATYRQTNGLSATLLNSPSITGPSGFVVPSSSSAGVDAGTATISSSPQAPPGTTPIATTFGTDGGVFGYGFAPANSSTSGSANFPQMIATNLPPPPANNAFCVLDPSPAYGTCISADVYAQPIYGSAATELPYVGGPPLYPYFNNGTFPSGFEGYPAGFTTFAATPVAGTYTLKVSVPNATGSFAVPPITSTLASTTLLPVMPMPTFTSDTTGGGTIGLTVPAGVTETLVYVFDFAYSSRTGDFTRKNFYTLETTGTGAQTLTLPDQLGNTVSGAVTPSLMSGDFYFVYAVGFDYPAFEAGPPANTQQLPTIVGANGQADVTLSGFTNGTY